jgi:hypothetical protein
MDSLGTFNEQDTPCYYALIKDDLGLVLDLTAADALTLTVYDAMTATVLNSRNAQNVKNTNGVTAYATEQSVTIDGEAVAYNLKWPLVAAEMAMVGTRETEEHRAMFVVTWSTTKRKSHECFWIVRNLKKVA